MAIPILKGHDYSCIFEEPSALEQVYAIFMNLLEVDEDGQVIDAARAHERVGQYIRSYVDDDYSVDPPFEQWELELY